MARHSIRKEDVKFVVNKEMHTVVCYMEDTEEIFIDFAIENYGNISMLPYEMEKLFKMPNRFVGKAVCSADDEWDEEKGKLLAYHRMKAQLNKAFFHAANSFFDYVDKMNDDFGEIINAYGEKLYHNTERRKAKIKELVGEDN